MLAQQLVKIALVDGEARKFSIIRVVSHSVPRAPRQEHFPSWDISLTS